MLSASSNRKEGDNMRCESDEGACVFLIRVCLRTGICTAGIGNIKNTLVECAYPEARILALEAQAGGMVLVPVDVALRWYTLCAYYSASDGQTYPCRGVTDPLGPCRHGPACQAVRAKLAEVTKP